MKYSKTALMYLSHEYSHILKKCALLNAAFLMGTLVALPTNAAEEATHKVVTADETITGEVFSAQSDTKVGGAILNSNSGEGAQEHTLTLNNTTFTGNQSGTEGTGGGGAVYNNANLVVNGGTFDGNIAGAGFGEEAATKKKQKSTKNGGNGGAIFNGEKGTLHVNGATFTNNEAKGKGNKKTGRGGAISTSGKADIEKSVFEGNKALAGGAVMIQGQKGEGANTPAVTITDSRFTGNVAVNKGGAIFNQLGTLTVTGSTFEKNEAIEGGAISVYGGKSSLTVTGSQFIGNKTTTDGNFGGGAIYADNGALEVANSVFDGNVSDSEGGAISSWADTTKISNSTFKNNKSMSGDGGGALYLFSETEIADSTFTNNHSDTAGTGGAIEVESDTTVKFAGTNVFQGNTQTTDSGKTRLNDIHISKDGKVVLQKGANVTLDGGIRGQKGTLKLQKDSTLNVKDTTVVASKVTGGKDATGHINVVLTDKTINNGGTLDIADIFTQQEAASNTLKNVKSGLNFQANNLYDVTSNGGNIYTVSQKNMGEIASRLNVNESEAATLLAVSSSKTGSGRADFDTVQDTLRSEAQYGKNSALLSRAADALVADAAPVVRVRETALQNTLFDTATDALDNSLTNAAVAKEGNLIDQAKVWIKGLFNYADKDETSKSHGFDVNTYGFAFGIDKNLNDTVKVGLGYAYSESDIDGYTRNTDVDTHSVFLYGKYKPADWYVNAIASYSFSNYEEKKSVLGYGAKAKYDVDTFGLQSMIGYDLNTHGFGITPEAGLRYMHIAKDSYTDGLGTSALNKSSNVLTGVAGVKATKSFAFSNGINIRPEVRGALTYDLTSDNNNTNVLLANGAAIRVNGEELNRFGVELGAKVAADICTNWEIAAGYEARIREDYVDHTGMLSAKYKF